jgi:uncharacterized OB-fold protein
MEGRQFNHSGFVAFIAEGQLMGCRCAECGAVYLPPQPVCARCYSTRMAWEPFSGSGRLEGFTVIAVGLPVMAAEGYSREKPYVSGVVRLAEGPALCAQIVGVDPLRPEEIHVGMEMGAVFGGPRLAFAPKE